jgi:hypothetical protein
MRLHQITVKSFLSMCALMMFSQAASGQKLSHKTFRLKAQSEVLLELTASAPGTSWAESESEAAVATLFVDDRYNQDIILFAGSQSFTYKVMLGQTAPGEHALRIDFNRKQSARKATSIRIRDMKLSFIEPGNAEYQALSLAPVLYARPNTIGRFSDIPLVMWYETEHDGALTKIRYSVIFTNEDGGTETSALMARWGRTTDIEWVYEVKVDGRGKVVAATFQGIKHQTHEFQGVEQNGHPALIVASDNNNVSDHGESGMRFALRPIPFDLSHNSREEIMDRHPWIYRLMTAELIREGKISETSKGGNQIADPRRYLYFEAESEQHGSTISFAVKLRGDQTWYKSDLGISRYRIDRSGYFRTTVRLPAGTRLKQIERVEARCDAADNPQRSRESVTPTTPDCKLEAVNKVFMLDKSYRPTASLPVHFKPRDIRNGEAIVTYAH